MAIHRNTGVYSIVIFIKDYFEKWTQACHSSEIADLEEPLNSKLVEQVYKH